MEQVLDVIAPIFGMAVIGYGAGRVGLLNENAGRGLSLFVFKLAIPIMLFRTLGRLEIPEVEWRGMAAYYGAAGAVYLGCAFFARRFFKLSGVQSGAYAMGSAFANTVLLALPIVLKVYGEKGALPLLLIISCHTTFLFSLGTVYVEAGRAEGKGLWVTLKTITRGLATNPIILGLASGLLLNITGLPLPKWMDEITLMFTQAAVPAALFSMGLSLCAFKLAGDLKQVIALVIWKLAVHPLIMWIFATFIFHLSPIWTSVTVLAAAMPSGVNAYLFAQGYESKEATVAAAVLLSTGLGMGTISLMLLIGPGQLGF